MIFDLKPDMTHHVVNHLPTRIRNTETAQCITKAVQIDTVKSFLPIDSHQADLAVSLGTSLFDSSQSNENGIFSTMTFSKSKLWFPKCGLYTCVKKRLLEEGGQQFVRNTLQTIRSIVVRMGRVYFLEEYYN